MATYKGIQGFTIQNLSADPSNPIEGQVWYNSTSNVWKVGELTTVGAWATANNMNTARSALAGAGTQTAAVGFGGEIPVGNSTATENYDGTSWSPSGNMATARRFSGGAGTQTAALAFGGYDGTSPGAVGATEEYNGSTWSPSNPLNTARYLIAEAGTQTAGLGFGGYSTAATGATEEYDGSTWTNNPTGLGTARYGLTGTGTQTAALGFGGDIPPNYWCN
jgi:hypothetical protein